MENQKLKGIRETLEKLEQQIQECKKILRGEQV
jgi:hypothetical protein